jgi:hypothetical protein
MTGKDVILFAIKAVSLAAIARERSLAPTDPVSAGWPLTKILPDPGRVMIRRAAR